MTLTDKERQQTNMAKNFAQNKGQRAERESIKILQPVVNNVFDSFGLEAPILQRNTLQSDRGGYDVVGVEWLALEIKHQETLNLRQWWDQCSNQAKKGQVPILMYKQNNVKWRIRMIGGLLVGEQVVPSLVDIDLESFLIWFEHRIGYELSLKAIGVK